jgi:hypothetical protein
VGDDENQLVRAQRSGGIHKAAVHQGSHVPLVRRGDEVRSRPLLDLQPKHLAPGERRANVDVGVGVLEGGLQRSERVDE